MARIARNRIPRNRTPLARPAVVAAAGALLLTGCGLTGSGEAGEESSPATVTVTASPSAASSSASTTSAARTASGSASSASASTDAPSAAASGAAESGVEDPELMARLEAVLLRPEDAPGGVFTDVELERAALETLETSLSLTGVSPTGACADLIERIDSQEVPGAGAVLATYTVDPSVQAGMVTDPAQAFTMAAVSQGDADLTSALGDLAETCGTVGGGSGPRAEFTPVPGVEDAARVAMRLSEGGDVMVDMVVGGASDGADHVYMGMVNVDPETAFAVLRAQVEAFEARER